MKISRDISSVKRELFMPGARYAWPELVEPVTGRPLGVTVAPVQPAVTRAFKVPHRAEV